MGCRPACKQLSFVHRYDYVPHDKPSMFCNDEQKETEIETCEPYSSSLFPLRVRFFPVGLSNLAHARSKVFQQYAAGGAPRSGSFKSGARSFKSLLKVRRWCGTAEPVFKSWHTFVQKSSKRMPPVRQREAGILKPQHDCTNVLLKHGLRQFFSSDAIWAQILQLCLVLLFHVAFIEMERPSTITYQPRRSHRKEMRLQCHRRSRKLSHRRRPT